MSNELFNRNLNVLRRHPAAYNAVVQAAKQYRADSYVVEAAKNGDPTLSFAEENQKSLAYHSRYNPVAEAEKQVSAGYEGQTHAMLLGFGLGYMAENILARLTQRVGGPQLFVIEPDAGIFVTALRHRDLTTLLADPRLALCIGLTADQVGDFWGTVLDWTVMERLAIFDHPPSAARFKIYFERVVEKIRYLCNRSKGNLVTLMHAGFEFHTNYFANLAASFALPGVDRLFERFKGVPAVIVAAGPSLDRNMHLLKQVKGRFPIVAVDTALRQLVANGIRPDIVCAADPSYENSLDFVGVENESDVVLAVEPMTHPDIFSSFKGPLMLMTFGGGLQPVIKDLREPVGTLGCWGSIATTNFELVRRMGADPIIFLGLDLSFQDGRLHARGSYSDDLLYEKVHQFTSIEHEAADYINTRGTYKFSRADGNTIYTDQNMKLYKDWFEDQFRQTTARVINATEGGIVDKYVEIMPFARVIEKYATKGVDVQKIIKEALERPVKADRDALIARLSQFRKTLRQNESEARQAVNVCRRLLVAHASSVAATLEGRLRAEFFSVMQLHDRICSDKDLFPWFSIHQTRFITRHTMEVMALKANNEATVEAWLQQILQFFAALEKFHEYQMPLLEQAVESLSRQTKPKTFREGAKY
ncbi:MAG TPA: DUF115 domain-containing protein [Candidatus Rifleibacterium sp.]|nr:DUF115 domain-containing protein [Candidatus Rifleibacterium sp.]HPT46137.1 DUF115 domain-containing protein [Candidatus Rifleibacterium sp.]